jgi:hypothetical protein
MLGESVQIPAPGRGVAQCRLVDVEVLEPLLDAWARRVGKNLHHSYRRHQTRAGARWRIRGQLQRCCARATPEATTVKQQQRHALSFLTTACEAAQHGRQPPSCSCGLTGRRRA